MDDSTRANQLLKFASELLPKLGQFCDVLEIRWARQAGFQLRVVDIGSNDPESYTISFYLDSAHANRKLPELTLGTKTILLKSSRSLRTIKELKSRECFWGTVRTKAA